MIKKSIGIIFFVFSFQTFAFASENNNIKFISCKDSSINPLAQFSIEWSRPEYDKCNTAKGLKYLTTTEQDVIWILNMTRKNPILFLNSVLLNSKSPIFIEEKKRNFYYNSLIQDLKILSPNQTPLLPDSNLFITAKCHAYQSGVTGYVGHNRKGNICKEDFYGECCYYGLKDAFVIVTSLLIDEKVRSLGHRKLMLDIAIQQIGVSIQPHKSYGSNTVLDFY